MINSKLYFVIVIRDDFPAPPRVCSGSGASEISCSLFVSALVLQ